MWKNNRQDNVNRVLCGDENVVMSFYSSAHVGVLWSQEPPHGIQRFGDPGYSSEVN